MTAGTITVENPSDLRVWVESLPPLGERTADRLSRMLFGGGRHA